MKILIAVSSKEYSGPTLSVGMNVSRAFKAPATIVDVGEKINEFSTKDVGMAHERIESWDFYRPGVDVLEWAFDYLADKKFIERSNPKKFPIHHHLSMELISIGLFHIFCRWPKLKML